MWSALSLLPLLACRAPAEPVSARPTPRHAMLIVLDTLRADVVEEVDARHLDGLAARGGAVDHAWSAGTWTVPSVISIFTGMPVRQHGWDEPTGHLGEYPSLPAVPLLAEVLSDAGFATEGHYSNPYLGEPLGFSRGFDSWRRSADPTMARQLGQQVAEGWSDGRRHFAYLHPLGPHTPLRPSAEARVRWGVDERWLELPGGLDGSAAQRDDPPGAREAYRLAYRAAVEDADALVGALVAALGPYRDDTLVVVTADHGEMLGAHGFVGHGSFVWETLTHVPLVVDRPMALPDTLGGASIPALITAALGVDATWPTARDAALPLVCQREGKLALSPDGHQKGLWDGTFRVFNLGVDPKETTPLPDDGSLLAARTAWEASTPRGKVVGSVKIAPETRDALRKLGYAD